MDEAKEDVDIEKAHEQALREARLRKALDKQICAYHNELERGQEQAVAQVMQLRNEFVLVLKKELAYALADAEEKHLVFAEGLTKLRDVDAGLAARIEDVLTTGEPRPVFQPWEVRLWHYCGRAWWAFRDAINAPQRWMTALWHRAVIRGVVHLEKIKEEQVGQHAALLTEYAAPLTDPIQKLAARELAQEGKGKVFRDRENLVFDPTAKMSGTLDGDIFKKGWHE